MSPALLRMRSNSRRGGSNSRAPASNSLKGPNIGYPPTNGPHKKAAERAQEFATVVAGESVGDLASAAGVSKETARNWKQGKRFPHGDALLDLGTNINAVNEYIHYRLEGHESPQAQQTYAAVEAQLASLPPHLRNPFVAQLKNREWD